MAYNKTLAKKGIKRRDPRMAAKGCEDPAVTSTNNQISLNQAADSVARQG